MRAARWLGLFVLVGTAWSQEITNDQKAEVLNKVNDVLHSTAFVPGVDFDQWPKFFESHKELINGATDRRSFILQLNRTLREFGTSHIGISVAKPKAKEGTREADALCRVMSQESQDKPPTQEPDKPSSQTLSWPNEHTAMLRLRTFNEGYSRAEVEKLMAEAAKADNLIIDLRGNGGGAVSNLQHFLSLLLPPRTVIGTMVSRRIADAYKKETKGSSGDGLEIAKWTDRKFRTAKMDLEPFRGKIAVLISRGSASASEICAAALREVKKAPLIGGNSAGMVLVARTIGLPDGLEMKVPTADFYTPSYRRLEKNPLEPDAPIPSRDTEGCVAKAIELLTAMKSQR